MDGQGTSTLTKAVIISTVLGALIAGIVEGFVSSFMAGTVSQLGLTEIASQFILPATFAVATIAVYVIIKPKLEPHKKSELNHSDKSSNVKPLSKTDIQILREMGLVGTVSTLEASMFDPAACMHQTQRRLYFMGILGSKWVITPHIRADFRSFLSRVQSRGGKVRFLLIDPGCTAFTRLKDHRGGEGAISTESLQHWSALQKDFQCLEVKLYSQFPSFRLVFIDDTIVAVSRYKIDKEGYFASKYGWSNPHLVFQANVNWSLYEAFELYFKDTWENAKDVNNYG